MNAADDLGVDGAEYAELAGAFWGGISAATVGLGLLGTSTWLFVTGEDPERYDDVGSTAGQGIAGGGR